MKTYITMSSKGQFTMPVKIREELKLETGDTLEVSFEAGQRKIAIVKPMSIQELRAMNQAALKRSGTSLKGYKSGDGFAAHVAEKYGA